MRQQIDSQRLEALQASIARNSLAVDYPSTESNTLAAFRDAFWVNQMQVKSPAGRPAADYYSADAMAQHEAFKKDITPLIKAFEQWPEQDKWQFINHWCDNLSVLTYTKLMPSIRSTASIGQSAVVSLITKEIDLATMLGVPADEKRIARWIESYTGRINLLPSISNMMKEKFKDSDLIDSALAGLVDKYVGGHDSFNAVARDSDFFIAVEYPKTFAKYLEHFTKTKLEFDVIEVFFRDMFISGAGIKPCYLARYRAALGDEAVIELFSTNVLGQRNCSGDGPVNSFKLALSTFGEDALLEAPQLKAELLRMQGETPALELLHWVSTQYMAMQDVAPRLHEMCVRRLPELMPRYRLLPAGPIMDSGVRILGGEGFLKHYLAALRGVFDKNVANVPDFRLLAHELKTASKDIHAMSDFELIEYAYATQRQSNNPVSTSIRNACHFAGVAETAKIAGDMSIQAAENLYMAVAYDQKRLVVEYFPNSQVLALERDLGL
ncbi:hypothetical protein RBE51_18690 [Pseudomonas taiwanensis]|uniref:hypothetical protein n=1 Tax=Pseudomonas taiwanensis TaxID=470150 RepID=UPI0028DF1DC8|nr:hypothetical protein [Pseudomonas taiwanensis]MDT8924822.1 hypothetical protein [Pseudomonas taiwanensis]